MNQQFNEKLRIWLETPYGERDYMEGATMLLQLNRNPHIFRMLTTALNEEKMKQIEYQLQKFYNARVQTVTHEVVVQMQQQVEEIVVKNNLNIEKEVKDNELKTGKRPDHDSLPAEIQALYTENLPILQRMRELHTRLRLITSKADGTYCPDNDRYPFLKELIELDKKYHDNWYQYDHYSASAETATATTQKVSKSKKSKKSKK